MLRTFLLTGAAALIASCGKPEADPSPSTEPTATAIDEPTDATPAAEGATETEAPEAEPFDASAASAGLYKLDSNHGYIVFSYDHGGYSHPRVRWGKWTADLDWNPDAPEQSSVTVVIDATAPDSGVDKFDEHLRSADFFDAAKYPEIKFVSTSLDQTNRRKGQMTGDLTIKGVTKPVTLDVKINKAADDAFFKAYKLGFSAKGTVKRSDFGVDKYVPLVGDDVAIEIEAEFAMPKETAAPAQ